MRHRQLWPTWLLCTRPTDEASNLEENLNIHMLNLGWFQYPHSSYETREFTWHRTFALEPLLIAQDILFESRLRPQVIGHAIRNTQMGEVPTIYEHFRGPTAGKGQRLFEGLGPAIIAQLKDDTDYSKWTLTRDTSLIAATQDEIQRALNLSDVEKKDWNSDGIELVSPTYTYEDIERGCRKLHRYLDKLEGSGHATTSSLAATIESDSDVDDDNSDPSLTQYHPDSPSHRTWATLKSPFAGSHVHIGVEWKEEEPINLGFLRHLAFLVISNEELISSLHAYKRRGTKHGYSPVDPIFTPTRDDHTAAEKDARKIAELSKKFISSHNLWSNKQSFMEIAWNSKQDVWNQAANIFLNPALEVYTFFSAVQRQQDEDSGPHHGSLVDFSRFLDIHVYRTMSNDFPSRRMANKERPPTIEFRQHDCSLSASEMEHWIRFLFSLVRLAEKRAIQVTDYQDKPLKDVCEGYSATERERSKYPPQPISTIQELCGPGQLELPDSEIRYWEERVQRFKNSKETYIEESNLRKRRRLRAVESKIKRGMKLTDSEVAKLGPIPTFSELRDWPELKLKQHLRDRLGLLRPENADRRQMMERIDSVEELRMMVRRMEINLRDNKIRRTMPPLSEAQERKRQQGHELSMASLLP